MPLKDVLVHIDNSDDSVGRLDLALRLAKAHEAHLSALYVAPPPPDLPPNRDYPASPWVLIAQAERASKRKSAQKVLSDKVERAKFETEVARQAFVDRTSLAGVASEWRAVEGALFDALTTYARFCDVAIVSQRYPEGERLLGKSLLDHLICSVGHAILLVPPGREFSTIGERIVIAWDRSPVALRAVHNARPFLRLAKEVQVLAVNIEAEDAGARPGSGIVQHLARHEIKAVPRHVNTNGQDVSEAILASAADARADLLVMGAYGHARLRERILGGVTYDIMRATTVPVLMTH